MERDLSLDAPGSAADSHCAPPHEDHGITAHTTAEGSGPFAAAARSGWRSGLAAAAALIALYGVTLALLNGAAYAWDTFLALWYWMVPLVAGFGIQVGLYGYSRALAHAGVSPHASGVVASGGASAVSMVACCAHHLVDVLPLVGLAGVALFFSSYQSLFLLGGLLSNVMGSAFLLGEMQKHRLYRQDGALLAPLLRLPVRKSVPWLGGLALLVFAIAVYWEVWA